MRIVQPANVGPADIGRLHHDLAHGGRLDPLDRGHEIFPRDAQLLQHIGRNRAVLQIEARHEAAHRLDRGFAGQRRHIRADKAVCHAGQFGQVDLVAQRHPARVDAQYLAPPALVRHAHHDFAVETPRTPQRLVNRFRPVGGRNHDQIGARFQPVHQRQQLRDEALFRLPCHLPPFRRDRIDFVDEQDRW